MNDNHFLAALNAPSVKDMHDAPSASKSSSNKPFKKLVIYYLFINFHRIIWSKRDNSAIQCHFIMLALIQPIIKKAAREGIIEIIAFAAAFKRGAKKIFTLRTDVHDDNQRNIYTIMKRLERKTHSLSFDLVSRCCFSRAVKRVRLLSVF